MENCTGKNIELDLSEQGMDLANLIFHVAQDCDNSYAFKGFIDASGFRDEILFQIKIAKVQYDNPNLSEAEIQKIVDALTAEHERKKTEEAAEKAAKIEKVQRLINGNAMEGYALAYRICKEDNSDQAKELAYRMVHRLKNITLEEKIEICSLYAESLINLGKSGVEIAKVYCRMAELVYPLSKRADHSLCLSFYEKALEYIDEPHRMLGEIIGFCNCFREEELRIKCQQKETELQSAQ